MLGSRVISPQGADGALGVGASFSIPEGLYERALDHPHVRFSANVMVSRRSRSGRLQFARLYTGSIGDNLGFGFEFEDDDVPYASENTALNFIRYRSDHTDHWTDPTLMLRWEPDDARGPSAICVSFKWRTAGQFDEDMDAYDIANCLEHFVDWSD